jgi:hypothetical protein
MALIDRADDRADVIARVCDALGLDEAVRAREVAGREYPFVPQANAGRRRSFTKAEYLRIFSRDNFIDRYSGTRLVFPGTLHLLSHVLPEEFPAHPNWKVAVSHIMYWELFPTIDHVVPVARGGPDDDTNWVTTSMLLNQQKSFSTLEELGWTKRPVTKGLDWDGRFEWFMRFVKAQPHLRENDKVDAWYQAGRGEMQMRFDGF